MGLAVDSSPLRERGIRVREYLRAMPLPFTSIAGTIVAHQFGWSDPSAPGPSAKVEGYLQSGLVLWSVSACGGDPEAALPVAAAVELFHLSALLHEQLQDDARAEAEPGSAVARWGVAQSLNAGDALYALAYETLTAAAMYPDRVLEVGRIVSYAVLQSIAVRRLDPGSECRTDAGLRRCLRYARGRRGALLAASLEAGGVMAGAEAVVVRNLRRAGRFLGIAVEMHAECGRDQRVRTIAERFAAKAIAAVERCSLDRTDLEAFKGMAHHAVTKVG